MNAMRKTKLIESIQTGYRSFKELLAEFEGKPKTSQVFKTCEVYPIVK